MWGNTAQKGKECTQQQRQTTQLQAPTKTPENSPKLRNELRPKRKGGTFPAAQPKIGS
jgi:hypothetical protein